MSHTVNRHLLNQGFPVLYECYGCAKLFSKNHKCEAVQETCSDCSNTGHYSGFCRQWKLPRLRLPDVQPSSSLLQQILRDAQETRETTAAAENEISTGDQSEQVHAACVSNLTENKLNINNDAASASNRLAASIEASVTENIKIELENSVKQAEGRSVRLVKFRGHTSQHKESEKSVTDLRCKLQMPRKRGPDVEPDVICLSEDKSHEYDLNYHKNLSASLREQNSVLSQKHDTLRNELNELKEVLNREQQESEKFQEKLRMYRNASLGKTLDHLREQTDRATRRVRELEGQREGLYRYILKVKVQGKIAKAKVDDLIREYKLFSDKLYPHYPKELLPSKVRPCKGCCSPTLHHPNNCVAKGIRCKICHRRNHLTAVCRKYDVMNFRPSYEEKELLQKVAQEIYH